MARLFAVLVGCDYQESGRTEVPPLQGAENDARALAALLAGNPIAGGELAHLALLTREEATTANLRRALQQRRHGREPVDHLPSAVVPFPPHRVVGRRRLPGPAGTQQSGDLTVQRAQAGAQSRGHRLQFARHRGKHG